jgi:hypothetical protein
MSKKTLILILFYCMGTWMLQPIVDAKVESDVKWTTVYEENFESQDEGTTPKDFFVLDGEFKVISKEGRKCLSLSGNPVGEHGFLFGPRYREGSISLSFSCLGAFKSRRHNVFAGALGGMRGLAFRINPSSQKVLFSKREEQIFGGDINWSSRKWMKIQLMAIPDPTTMQTSVNLLVSDESSSDSFLQKSKFILDETLASGRSLLWGFSYAGEQMFWDNLLIRFRN